MKNFNNGPISESCLLEANHPGPTISVVGGTHGDELVGVEVVKKLSESVEVTAGKVLLLVGNPLAVTHNTRFVHHNANRIMNSKGLEAARSAKWPTEEQLRALELAHLLGNFKPEILLDVHNTTLPSTPFLYCENKPEHLEATKFFGLADSVYSPAAEYEDPIDGAIDNFVDNQGGLGITYETGCLSEGSPQAMVDQVCQEIKHLLAQKGCIDGSQLSPQEVMPKDHFEIFDKITAQQKLTFVKPIKTGLTFKEGEVIALDGETPVVAPEDCVILFPKGQKVRPGHLACELARHKGTV